MAVYRLVLPKKVALAVILLVQKGEGLGVSGMAKGTWDFFSECFVTSDTSFEILLSE